MRRRRGFALLAVLWVVVALAALLAGAVARVRLGVDGVDVRVARMRARWAAAGCLAVAQSRLDSAAQRRELAAPAESDTLHYANGLMCSTSAVDPDASDDTLIRRYGDGRVNLNAAPDTILAPLPGIGAEARRVITEARLWHRPLIDLNDLSGRLTPQAREALQAHFVELNAASSFRSASLVLTSSGWGSGSATGATIQVLVVDAGNRAAVVRRRMW